MNPHNKGISIYFAVVIMSIMLAIVLGVATIVIRLLQSTTQLGTSVTAFYAADTGIERLLYKCTTKGCSTAGTLSGGLSNGAQYSISYDEEAVNATSTGVYNGVKRSIYINRQ